jgi:site-specific DNA recombinase
VNSRRLTSVPDSPPRAILYLRQSVSRDESISLELQETACRDYCARRGYLVAEVIADPGISGRTWNRPGVQRTLQLIEQRSADVIVLWRWSRLSRSRRDWAVAVDRVEVAGGRIESATEPVDTATAAGRLQRGMLAELAAWESDVKGEQWRETHARRRSLGLPHNGGYRPGYVYEGKVYRVDLETAPLIREVYERYVSGQGLRPIAVWLTAVGVPSRVTGSAWTHRGVSSHLKTGWAAGLLHVHDPGCGCRDADTCGRRLYVPGAQEPIIGGKLWAAYRVERARRQSTPRRQLVPTTALAGLVRCGSCGYGMRSATGGVRPGHQYKCGHVGCAEPTSCTRARAEAVAREWVARYAHRLDERAGLLAAERASKTAAKSTTVRLARSVARLDEELTRLTREFTRGVVPESAYLAARDELVAERLTASVELNAAARKVGPPLPSPAVAARLLEQWDGQRVSPAGLNRTLRSLLRVVVRRGEWRSAVEAVAVWDWESRS